MLPPGQVHLTESVGSGTSRWWRSPLLVATAMNANSCKLSAKKKKKKKRIPCFVSFGQPEPHVDGEVSGDGLAPPHDVRTP